MDEIAIDPFDVLPAEDPDRGHGWDDGAEAAITVDAQQSFEAAITVDAQQSFEAAITVEAQQSAESQYRVEPIVTDYPVEYFSPQYRAYSPLDGQQATSPATGKIKKRLIKTTWLRRLVKIALSLLATVALVVGGLFGYIYYRFSQVKKVSIPGIVKVNSINEGGENILLVGSNSLGGPSSQSVDNLDVVMLFHLDLTSKKASILSLPPLLEVGLSNMSNQESFSQIFTHGPAALVRAITEVFDIPINHYVGIDYAGVKTLVSILNGVSLKFPYPSRDPYSGLNITQPGCQSLNGDQAVELLRSNDFEYLMNGAWQQDNSESIGIAQRQRTLLGAVGAKAVRSGITNPLLGNRFLGSLVNDILLDSTYSITDLFSLVNDIGGSGVSNAQTFAIPTYVSAGPNGTILLNYHPTLAQQIVQTFLGASVGQNISGQSSNNPGANPTTSGNFGITSTSGQTNPTTSGNFGITSTSQVGQPGTSSSSATNPTANNQGQDSTFFDPSTC